MALWEGVKKEANSTGDRKHKNKYKNKHKNN